MGWRYGTACVDGATERQSGAAPGSSPEAGMTSFKGIFPGMNRFPRIHHALRWRSFGSDPTAAHHIRKGTRVSGMAYISKCGAFVTPFQSNSAVFDTGARPAFLLSMGRRAVGDPFDPAVPREAESTGLGGSRPAANGGDNGGTPDDAALSQSPPEAA